MELWGSETGLDYSSLRPKAKRLHQLIARAFMQVKENLRSSNLEGGDTSVYQSLSIFFLYFLNFYDKEIINTKSNIMHHHELRTDDWRSINVFLRKGSRQALQEYPSV